VFDSAKALETRLLQFIRDWNRYEAHPFCWTFKGYPLQSVPKAAESPPRLLTLDIQAAARTLEKSLEGQKRFKHLRVKKRGQSLTIFSGEAGDPWFHARLQRRTATGDVWQLSFPNYKGRWQRTPFVGSLAQLTALLVRDFAFHLHDFGLSERK
jgi:hypothetical protein